MSETEVCGQVNECLKGQADNLDSLLWAVESDGGYLPV